MVEDFKLTTGTFVHVGSLRTDAIAAATPVVQDALVAGQDRPFVGLLAWPNLHACRQIVGNPDATFEDVVRHPEVIACLKRGLEAHNTACKGSSMRIARAMLMVEPPSIDGNELTDKGYINQRAGLERRAALVQRLYADPPGDDVIMLNEELSPNHQRRPRERGDPYAAAPVGSKVVDAFRNHRGRWLWVPAFAGTTN